MGVEWCDDEVLEALETVERGDVAGKSDEDVSRRSTVIISMNTSQ